MTHDDHPSTLTPQLDLRSDGALSFVATIYFAEALGNPLWYGRSTADRRAMDDEALLLLSDLLSLPFEGDSLPRMLLAKGAAMPPSSHARLNALMAALMIATQRGFDALRDEAAALVTRDTWEQIDAWGWYESCRTYRIPVTFTIRRWRPSPWWRFWGRGERYVETMPACDSGA
ncbi:hypothetical protein [Demequina zhanjiangensis]|uniref:Uncharacterized protein n=1 Tax=Demequina zhanjiangensis TaxID=3051659 RepID=A0ABT8FZ39_9MICO|nr:hypothetical protein [Demequina sp. SYSU T00b26]MDN4472112.1 hypothetical protein [Demequina sp. SYSU T00b26]